MMINKLGARSDVPTRLQLLEICFSDELDDVVLFLSNFCFMFIFQSGALSRSRYLFWVQPAESGADAVSIGGLLGNMADRASGTPPPKLGHRQQGRNSSIHDCGPPSRGKEI